MNQSGAAEAKATRRRGQLGREDPTGFFAPPRRVPEYLKQHTAVPFLSARKRLTQRRVARSGAVDRAAGELIQWRDLKPTSSHSEPLRDETEYGHKGGCDSFALTKRDSVGGVVGDFDDDRSEPTISTCCLSKQSVASSECSMNDDCC